LKLELEIEFEVELKLELEIEFEVELKLELEIEFEVELKLELEIEFEVELKLELELEFEFEVEFFFTTQILLPFTKVDEQTIAIKGKQLINLIFFFIFLNLKYLLN